MEMEAEAEAEGKALLDVYLSVRSDAGYVGKPSQIHAHMLTYTHADTQPYTTHAWTPHSSLFILLGLF